MYNRYNHFLREYLLIIALFTWHIFWAILERESKGCKSYFCKVFFYRRGLSLSGRQDGWRVEVAGANKLKLLEGEDCSVGYTSKE